MLYIKQLLRSPIRLISFFALLVFTGSAIGIGINAYFAMDRQIVAIENNYTTIAVPNYMYDAYTYVPGTNEYMSFEDELELMSSLNKQLHERADYVDAAIEVAYNSPYVMQIELRNAAGGYCSGIDPVANYDMDLQGGGTYTSDIAMLVVTCTDIVDDTAIGASVLNVSCDIEESIFEGAIQKSGARIIHKPNPLDTAGRKETEIIEQIDSVKMSVGPNDVDGGFEVGSSYIVWGRFLYDEYSKELSLGAPLYDVVYPDGWTQPYYPHYPKYCKLPEGMSADEFLSQENNILSEVYRMIEVDHHGLQVVPTDNLMSIVCFATDESPILFGRGFTKEEYEQGANVCIISTSLAIENELDVGDSIDMMLYNRGKETRSTDSMVFDPYFEGQTVCMDTKSFEVVGIYRDNGFSNGIYDFNPNTVFIPNKAVTDPRIVETVSYYEDIGMDISADYTLMPTRMRSIVLQNGTIDAFEQEMTDAGYWGCFIYEDQGYTEMMDSVLTMKVNVQRIAIFSGGLFIIALLLFVFLYNYTFRKTSATMRLIGNRGVKVYCAVALSSIGIAFIAFIVSAVLSYLLFDTVCANIASDEIGLVFSPMVALGVFAAQLLLTALAGMLFPIKYLRNNPMKLMKGDR